MTYKINYLYFIHFPIIYIPIFILSLSLSLSLYIYIYIYIYIFIIINLIETQNPEICNRVVPYD